MDEELLDLLACLAEDGNATAAEVAVLERLIVRGDPRVGAAYDAYVMFRDVDDLIDTLQRIARLEGARGGPAAPAQSATSQAPPVAPARPASAPSPNRTAGLAAAAPGRGSAAAPSYAPRPFDDDEDSDDDDEEGGGHNDNDEGDEDDDDAMALGADERKEILMLMLERKVLSHAECVVLVRKLLVHDDPFVAEAFDVFEGDHDGAALLAVLKDLAAPPGSGAPAGSRLPPPPANGASVGDHSDDDSDSDPEATEAAMQAYAPLEEASDDDAAPGQHDASLAKVFMGVVRSMRLSEGEATALRLCIARDDPHVRAALEVFKLERDEADLRDTLKRVARRTLEEAQRQLDEQGRN
jgi:hypothetical protein